MKTLSESLEELAARVKVIEDSATATYEVDRAQLEQRLQEIDEAFRATPLKAVEAWIDNHLGPTVQSQRGVLQAVFSAESVTKVG